MGPCSWALCQLLCVSPYSVAGKDTAFQPLFGWFRFLSWCSLWGEWPGGEVGVHSPLEFIPHRPLCAAPALVGWQELCPR